MLLTRLPLIISLLLAAALGGVIYLQVIEILNPTNQNTPVKSASPSAATKAQPTQKTYNISSYKLFGSVDKTAPKVEKIPDKLPKTKLRLTLRGVQAGELEQKSGALIEGPDRDTSYYKIGDQLPGNATLTRVFPDRVVIQRTGKLENLYFPESFASTGGLLAANEPDNQPVPVASKPQKAPAARVEQMSEARKQTIKDRLSKLRQRINSGQ